MSAVPDDADAVRATVTRCLGPLSQRLTDVLSQMVAYRYPDGVAVLEFEVFPDPGSFTDTFPVRAFFMNDNNCEHFEYRDGKATYPCSVDPDLLNVSGVLSESAWDEIESEHPELDVCTLAAEALVLWFHSCWRGADGASLRMPAFISLHDDGYAFDLKDGIWIDIARNQRLPAGYPHRR